MTELSSVCPEYPDPCSATSDLKRTAFKTRLEGVKNASTPTIC